MHASLASLDPSAILQQMLGVALAALPLAPGRERLAVELNVLAAGATESTVRDMAGTFEKESGHTVKPTYGADVVLVGPYPGDLQNMTTYTGILLTRTPHPEAARAFLRFLTSPPVQARSKQAGFEPPR